MRCPNCGNEVYELIDYAIARCTNYYSLWDPYVYPGFPTPDVEVGDIWDTSESEDEELSAGENDDLEDSNDDDEESDDREDWELNNDEEDEFGDDSDGWDQDDDQEDDY